MRRRRISGFPAAQTPQGYAEWFDEINYAARIRATPIQKQRLFDVHRVMYRTVQDVPDALVRTPLQRAIQILKRHRDVRFARHELADWRPISIILTTLAARAYENEVDVASALSNILERISDYATSGVLSHEQERWLIPNPVNPAENFADRWNEHGSRHAEAFFAWIAWAQEDLANAGERQTSIEAKAMVFESFGGMSPTGTTLRTKTGTAIAVSPDSVPNLGGSSHCQPPPWPLQLQRAHRVTVTGSVRQRIDATKHLWALTDRAVAKSLAIRFEATTTVPAPYSVKWQIVNTGPEAAAAGTAQLRGGFDEGKDPMGAVRWEGTAYRGTHWVEAFVVKDGACLARSGRKLVKIK